MFTIPQFQYFKWNTVTAVTPISALTEFYDTFYNYVSLIINAESTLAVYNNSTFIDSSTNNFSISTVGTPSQGSFSPYSPAGWSVLCTNGTIRVPNTSAFNLSADDFTIEFWGYNTAARGGSVEAWKFGIHSSQFDQGIYLGLTTGPALLLGAGGGWASTELGTFSFAYNPTYYEWHHYATVRKGKYITSYVDGIAIQRAVYSTAIKPSEAISTYGGLIGTNFNGYISDFRVIRGEAIYSGDTFNPPTTPLENTPKTILLTCNSNKIEDKSSYNWSLTSVNNPPIIPTSPYTDYNSSNYSGYFRGSTSYITYTTNTNYALSGSSFTVECWVYPTSLAGGNNYYTLIDAALSSGWDLSLKDDGSVSWQANSIRTDLSAGSITRAKWHHIAASYSTQTSLVSVFVNGKLIGTSTSVPTNTATVALELGRASNNTQLFTGYISNVRISKGISRYNTNFTPVTSGLTSDSNTMLLTLNSSVIFDNSSKVNSYTNSNISMTRFSPFTTRSKYTYNNYSAFYGSNASLGINSLSSIELSGSDFTVEFWAKNIAHSAQNGPVIVIGDSGSANTRFFKTDFGPVSCNIFMGAGASALLNQNFLDTPNGSWKHYAFTRRGNTISAFVNGVSAFGAAIGNPVTSVGKRWSVGNFITSTSNGMRGYLSNVRVVSGQAIYTGDFTPSTSPLLSSSIGSTGSGVAASLSGQVVLLMHNTELAEDKSSLNSIVTLYGAVPIIVRDSPFSNNETLSAFDYTATYTQSAHGGSGYFNGTNDFLRVQPSTDFSFGTGDFTIECWYYPTATKKYPTAFEVGNHGTAGGFAAFMQNNTALTPTVYSGAFTSPTNTKEIRLNSWNHIVWQRTSGNLKIFVNGIGSDNAVFSTNLTQSASASVGYAGSQLGAAAAADYYSNGYISDVRVVKGTALYASNFTPPTQPLSAATNTKLLLNTNNGSVLDTNTESNIVLSGGASSTASMAKYGGRSIQLNGTNQFFFRPETESVIITTGIPYTFEGWFYPTTTSYLSARVLFSKRTATANQINYAVYADATTGNLCFQTGSSIFKSTSALTLSAWNHVAMVYDGGRVYLYKDGTRVISTSALAAVTNNAGSSLYFGYDFETKGNFFEGYIDEIRATKGLIRYGGETFTVPSSSFLTT
jgi:hypothetical protein